MRLKLDDRDIQILSILQHEGRITKTELAQRVNLSPTPCWERLKHLEQAGIIAGYGAHLSWKKVPLTMVFMEVELSSHQAHDFDHFENMVQSLPEVLECWAVGGGIDYLLKVVTASVDEYQRLVDRLLRANIGLKRYYTYIVTKPVKNSQSLPDALLRHIDA